MFGLVSMARCPYWHQPLVWTCRVHDGFGCFFVYHYCRFLGDSGDYSESVWLSLCFLLLRVTGSDYDYGFTWFHSKLSKVLIICHHFCETQHPPKIMPHHLVRCLPESPLLKNLSSTSAKVSFPFPVIHSFKKYLTLSLQIMQNSGQQTVYPTDKSLSSTTRMYNFLTGVLQRPVLSPTLFNL